MKYRSIFASQDLVSKLKLYLNVITPRTDQLFSIYGIDVYVWKALPLDSGLFVDSGGNVVGIYFNGKLVDVPLDSAINYLAISPLAIKKKPLLEVSDE